MKKSLKKLLAAAAISAMSLNVMTVMPNKPVDTISASAVTTETSKITYVDSSSKLAYIFIPHSDNKTCTLFRVYDTVQSGNDWTLGNKTTLIIPSTVKDSSGKQYTITELGSEGQSIFHNYNYCSTRVKTLTLPNTVKIINSKALYDTEMNALKTLNINLEALEFCSVDAFGSNTAISEVAAYDSALKKYVSTTASVDNFNKAFGINQTDFISFQNSSCKSDVYKAVSSSINGKLEFINAIACSPYSKKAAYKFAEKIVSDNNINSSSNSRQQKYEMIYNYMVTNNRYSALYSYDSDNEKCIRMENLSGSALSNLAFHSGVCGSFAHGFEMLCRAAGVEALCVGLPGHAANAVRLNSNGNYYMIDCTANVFMQGYGEGVGKYDSEVSSYVYGLDTTRSECDATQKMIKLSDKYCSSFSYISINDMTNKEFQITLTDANNSSKKYIDYITRSLPIGKTKLEKLAVTKNESLYIDSNTYYNLTIKYGNTTVKTINNVFHGYRDNKFKVGNVEYNCIVETVDYAETGVIPHSSYTNYFKITIKPV